MLLSKADAMKAVNKKRTEKITPLEPVQTQNGSGGFNTVWTPRISSMAKSRKPDLKTEIVAGAISSVLFRELEVIYRTDIKKGWQVLCESKKYSVEHAYHYGTETTILVCKEIAK
jgi:SPP1 family predicted phage head-tail adaptor